jgi:hypothetical protein
MYTFLVLSLFFLPLLHAERYQTPLENQGDVFLPRSSALYYLRKRKLFLKSIASQHFFSSLVSQPMARYPYPAADQNVDQLTLSNDESRAQKQRTKRIYWENLAFHAANFNQKVKKL